jgi:Phage terminase large subunit
LNEEIIRYKGNSFQKRIHNALKTNKKIIALFGGWGVGKTEYTALDHIINRQLYYNPDVLHLIAANTYSQLFDSTLRPLFKWFELLGIPHRPIQIPTTHTPFSIHLHNGNKWVEFLIRSMENIDTISGVTLGSAWGDEMWGTEQWTFDLIDSRLRDMQSKLLQFVITSNTDEPSHWLYTELVQKYEFNIKPEDGVFPRDIIEIVHGSTFENQKNLPPGYLEAKRTTLDQQMWERFILCKWVSLGSGKMFYNFDRELHLRPLKYENNLPLLVSSDFNVDPMCWSIWQRHKDELHCIDQIKVSGNADTETCCRELHSRYFQDPRNHRYIQWFGDASGRSGSTKSQHSDYDIIKDFFRKSRIRFDLNVDLANPSIRDSANEVNARLKNGLGQINLFFDKQKCPDVILSIEGCAYKPGTTEKDDSKDRDPKQKVKTHFSDTVRYIIHQLFPLRMKTTWRQ